MIYVPRELYFVIYQLYFPYVVSVRKIRNKYIVKNCNIPNETTIHSKVENFQCIKTKAYFLFYLFNERKVHFISKKSQRISGIKKGCSVQIVFDMYGPSNS